MRVHHTLHEPLSKLIIIFFFLVAPTAYHSHNQPIELNEAEVKVSPFACLSSELVFYITISHSKTSKDQKTPYHFSVQLQKKKANSDILNEFTALIWFSWKKRDKIFIIEINNEIPV